MYIIFVCYLSFNECAMFNTANENNLGHVLQMEGKHAAPFWSAGIVALNDLYVY